MEYVVVATLIGAGWLWQKQNAEMNEDENGQINRSNHQTPYESNHVDHANKVTRQKAAAQFNTVLPAIDAARRMPLLNEEMVTTLSGQKIPKSQFKHKNMKPFFGSKMTQNMNVNQNKTLLETFTGTAPLPEKKEVKPFFDLMPEEPLGRNVLQDIETQRKRYNPSFKKQNVLPFEQQQVSSAGSYSQFERDAVMPRSIDALRSKTNQKKVYEGRIIPGKSVVDDRTLQPEMFKNRPETDPSNKYILRTTGAYKREEQHPTVVLRNTDNKELHFSYQGNAAPQNEKKLTMKSKSSAPLKHQLKGTGVTNSVAIGQWTSKNSLSDYGRSSIRPADMNVTEKRSSLSNVVTTVKSLMAPFKSDILPTLREEYEKNSHTGNVTGPTKLTHYDPDDVARTTLREQTSAHSYIGVAGSKNSKPVDQTATENASFNELKEYLETNRAPTQTGVKVMAGQETVNMTQTRSTYAAQQSAGITPIHKNIRSGDSLNLSNKRNNYSSSRNELDTSIMDSLDGNPYAISITKK